MLAVFHRWLFAQRQRVPNGSATMRAIDYSLKRWDGLTRFVDDRDVPSSNNWVGHRIRPIAPGRSPALRRQPACGQTRRGGHEPAALSAHQRTRPLRVPERRTQAVADPSGKPHRRCVKVTWPDACNERTAAATGRHYLTAKALTSVGMADR